MGVQSWMGYDHSHIIDPVGLSGEFAVFWKDSYKVSVLFSSSRLIDVEVTYGSIRFFITFVYGIW